MSLLGLLCASSRILESHNSISNVVLSSSRLSTASTSPRSGLPSVVSFGEELLFDPGRVSLSGLWIPAGLASPPEQLARS